jgi:hypothetical protein
MQGPNVVLNSIFHGKDHVQPNQRWSTGILIDSCQVPEGGIDLMNRGPMGSGHGWTMGRGVPGTISQNLMSFRYDWRATKEQISRPESSSKRFWPARYRAYTVTCQAN